MKFSLPPTSNSSTRIEIMEDLSAYENENYVKAKPVGTNFLKLFFKTIEIIFNINIRLCCEIFVNLFNFIRGRKLKNISGQVALVTGGANGLGREIAIQLAKEKCKIAVVDINLKDAENTAKFIRENCYVEAKAFKVDVSKFEEIEKLKIGIEKSLGFVDILVNNAGIVPLISMREGNPGDIDKIIDVNLKSHFWTVRAFMDGMIERKRGHIVAIASFSAHVTYPCAVAYCTSKFGVKGFMSALYDELCAYDHDAIIKLTTIYPTFINTRREIGDILDSSDEFIARLTPEEVANATVQGILNESRNVDVPSYSKLLRFTNCLPDKTRKYATTKQFDAKNFLKFFLKQQNKPNNS